MVELGFKPARIMSGLPCRFCKKEARAAAAAKPSREVMWARRRVPAMGEQERGQLHSPPSANAQQISK